MPSSGEAQRDCNAFLWSNDGVYREHHHCSLHHCVYGLKTAPLQTLLLTILANPASVFSYLQWPYFLNLMCVITLPPSSNVCSYPACCPHSVVYNKQAELLQLYGFSIREPRPPHPHTECVKSCLAIYDSLCSFGVMYVVNVEQQNIPTARIYLIFIAFWEKSYE